MKSNLRVDADGNLDRYLQECMMVHDLSLIHILCVLNYEDDVLRDSAKEMPCDVTFFSSKQKIANGLYQNDNNDIVDATTGEALMNMSECNLPGDHTCENIMAAIFITSKFGVPTDTILSVSSV